MLPVKNHWLYFVMSLFIVLGLIMSTTNSVLAQGIKQGTGTLEDDLFLTGDEIVISGPVDGDVIAIGGTITINAPISGSLVAIGRDVIINDEIGGSVYVGSVTLELGEISVVNRSVYFLGLRLSADSGSTVERDLTVLSISASLSGSVGRN